MLSSVPELEIIQGRISDCVTAQVFFSYVPYIKYSIKFLSSNYTMSQGIIGY